MDKSQGDRAREKPKPAERRKTRPRRANSKQSGVGLGESDGEWSGFESCDMDVRERVLQKKVGMLEEVVRQLKN